MWVQLCFYQSLLNAIFHLGTACKVNVQDCWALSDGCQADKWMLLFVLPNTGYTWVAAFFFCFILPWIYSKQTRSDNYTYAVYTWDTQSYLQISLGDWNARLWLILVVKCPNIAQLCNKAANISYSSLEWSFLLLFHRTLTNSQPVLQSSKEQLFLHKCFLGEFLMAVFWVCSRMNHWSIPSANSKQKRAVFQTKWLTQFSRLYRKAWRGFAHPRGVWGVAPK